MLKSNNHTEIPISVIGNLIKSFHYQKRVSDFYFTLKNSLFLTIKKTNGSVIQNLSPEEWIKIISSIVSLEGSHLEKE